MDAQAIAADATGLLADLVGFDTVSRHSNLALIGYVEAYLARHGIAAARIASADGAKANLHATIGPAAPGGIVLSGHTDVVPVDGQRWTSDPFALVRRGERLYGRGTCDMKGFIALSLAAVPAFAGGTRPVHLAFSYDEEVGCLGAPAMIAALAELLPPVAAAIVGEPTDMAVVGAHKGIASFVVTVTGHEAHSSLTHLGASANAVAIRLMALLMEIAARLERDGDPASPFVPPHATLTVGQVNGGTAVNILARECVFVFDLRCPPGLDADTLLAPFHAEAARMDAMLRARYPEAGVAIERRSRTPPLDFTDGAAAAIARSLSGDDDAARAVPYAAEAGQFQAAGFSTVLCGPGSIEQAHQPNEYLEIGQLHRGGAFMDRLAAMLRD